MSLLSGFLENPVYYSYPAIAEMQRKISLSYSLSLGINGP